MKQSDLGLCCLQASKNQFNQFIVYNSKNYNRRPQQRTFSGLFSIRSCQLTKQTLTFSTVVSKYFIILMFYVLQVDFLKTYFVNVSLYVTEIFLSMFIYSLCPKSIFAQSSYNFLPIALIFVLVSSPEPKAHG